MSTEDEKLLKEAKKLSWDKRLPLRRRRAAGVSTRAVAAAPTAERRRVATGKRSVAETFTRLRDQGKTAFIPFITAGDPDLATTSRALRILDSCGSDVIELGLHGSTYNTNHTNREDGRNHKSFRRICLSCKRQWSYRSPLKREPACQGSSSGDLVGH